MGISKKLFLLIFVTGTFCMLLFRFLWLQRRDCWWFLIENIPDSIQILPKPEDDFWEKLYAQALQCDVPESEDDKEAVEALAPFFALADPYTALYVYGLEDGMYRAGKIPEVMDGVAFESFFRMGYVWTNGDGEQPYRFPLQFRNGYASVIVNFYHSSCFIFPYLVFCLFASVFCFFAVILFFVNRKLKAVIRLERAILQMSAGDLETPVPSAGRDEVGILARELDSLRLTLSENFEKERKIRKSNQELIAALSHDLRTPLTILKGYLEILRLNRNPKMQDEYALRCMRKTEDIQEMTDRMFEYALVYDEMAMDQTDATFSNFPLSFFAECLREHADFLNLTGFSVRLVLPDDEILTKGGEFTADSGMAGRVFNNLFSNIIKYADKKEEVVISVSMEMPSKESAADLSILIANHVKTGRDDEEGSKIGLRSVGKMMERMNGKFDFRESGGVFEARLRYTSAGSAK